MSDRESFLAAIVANPADDLPRLVYADWLEENGEPERAEFIRIQVDVERQIGSRNEAALRARADELVAGHGAAWLDGLDPNSPGCVIQFRRGFPDTLTIQGRRLAESAEQLATIAPTLREVSVVGTRTFGATLSRCEFLNPVRVLRLEDWPYQDDVANLASSQHLPKLRTVSWWLGSRHDEANCRTLSRARWLRQLDRVELIQLYGGLASGGLAEECDANATRCQAIANHARGVTIAKVNRAFDAEFMIPEKVGQNLYAGTIRAFQPVLLFIESDPRCCEAHMLLFDSGGGFVNIHRLELPWFERRDAGHVGPAMVMQHAIQSLSYRPGPIRVREFDDQWNSNGPSARKIGRSISIVLADPDEPDSYHYENWVRVIEEVRLWLRSPDCSLVFGGQEYRISGSGKCTPLN